MSIMQTATSGMKAQANRLATVGDNIANASTTGYKKVSTEFAPLVLPSSSSSFNSGGVETTVRRSVSLEGGLNSTTSTTDLALRGNGFFVVEDSSGARYMTRAGSFVPNAEGYLVNAAGYYLTGYQLRDGDASVVLNSLNGGERINVNNINMQATPTTEGVFAANLNGRGDVPAVAAASLPSANVTTSTFTSKSSMVVYDNLGGDVMIDIYFTKTGVNTWEMSIFNQAAATGGGFPYTGGALVTTNLTFSGTTGAITAPASAQTAFTVPGGQPTTVDLSGLTQLKSDYTPLEPEFNGNAPSTTTGVSISADGIVSFAMKNGSTIDAYRIALADVPSPDNLTALSGGVFQANYDSGNPQVGFPGQGGLGAIRTSALEASNVDLADELATMIEAQRNYTANSKVFQTGAEVLEVLVNLKR
ncbi:flagellar hook protein FlgE [Pseudochelatococcus lubricantis]|uniref:Flagellar hook protein FlgE n=1 Tax=Pseudochelatococcus lubricantis TaxID=1538102 RepID=A0ABX0UWI9_9HYPH|nr:flagellar hook protein FlgE [Pseudochelatococcus lubricantis]